MLDYSVVIVGVGRWEEYTKPCIDSLLEQAPGSEIIVIDNGAQYPEAYHSVKIVQTPVVQASYAESLNTGIQLSTCDWMILVNNDVLFQQPLPENLDSDTLYGFYEYQVSGRKVLSGWCWFLAREMIQDVGLFDQRFIPMYFEDYDYSLRAVDAGYNLSCQKREDWGIVHLEERHGERSQIKESLEKDHMRNLDYLIAKHNLEES